MLIKIILHKEQEIIPTLVVYVRKQLQHNMISLIDAILSVMSGFIIEQRAYIRISAIDCNPLFSSLQ